MNLGQYLTTRSPLTTGTVVQHLLAIHGSGLGATVLTSRMSVVLSESSTTVLRQRRVQVDAPEATKPLLKAVVGKKTAYATTRQAAVAVRTSQDAVTVTTVNQQAVVKHHGDSFVANKKRSR